MSLKEKLSSTKASKAMLEKDIQNLKRELSSSLDTKTQLEEKVYSIDRAYEELDKERDRLNEVINQLGQDVSTKEHELEEMKMVTMKYQEVVEKAQDTLKYTAKERDEALAEKSIAQSQVIEFEGKLNTILIDLNQCVQREKSLLDEVEQLKKSRSSLQDLATKVRSENVSLEHQLADERVQRERLGSENKELKEIWESEVKTKHKLTDKIMEMELVQKEVDGTAHQEKKKIKKIIEQKEIMQMKIDTLQEKNTQLQRENGEFKASLREVKKQVKLMESRRFDELNLSKMADSSEIIGLHQKISQLQDKVKYEADLKVVSEDKVRQLEHELTLAHKTLEDTKHEVSEASGRRRKEEKKITNLTEELNRLQDHLSQLTVPKEQYDAVNSELKESYFENQKMARDISDSKHKLQTLLSDVDKLKMDKVAAEAETRRYKEMLDREIAKRDTLTSRLENARKRTGYSKSRVEMERLETERLLEDSHRKYGHKSRLTSTPSFDRRSSPVDENLLQDVRERLDRSIASHRDSTLSYSMLGGSLNETEFKKESHLESIKRQYRLH